MKLTRNKLCEKLERPRVGKRVMEYVRGNAGSDFSYAVVEGKPRIKANLNHRIESLFVFSLLPISFRRATSFCLLNGEGGPSPLRRLSELVGDDSDRLYTVVSLATERARAVKPDNFSLQHCKLFGTNPPSVATYLTESIHT